MNLYCFFSFLCLYFIYLLFVKKYLVKCRCCQLVLLNTVTVRVINTRCFKLYLSLKPFGTIQIFPLRIFANLGEFIMPASTNFRFCFISARETAAIIIIISCRSRIKGYFFTTHSVQSFNLAQLSFGNIVLLYSAPQHTFIVFISHYTLHI